MDRPAFKALRYLLLLEVVVAFAQEISLYIVEGNLVVSIGVGMRVGDEDVVGRLQSLRYFQEQDELVLFLVIFHEVIHPLPILFIKSSLT